MLNIFSWIMTQISQVELEQLQNAQKSKGKLNA